MTHYLINTQKDVDQVCRRLGDEEAIGVDTEFLRVRTYFPRLALVQVSSGDAVYCVDPLVEGIRLEPLWAILTDPGVCKVMHAARQDIEVLLHTADVLPAPLFDTQVAAALVGYGEQLGYAGLVEAEFGEALPKSSQRTDWTRRPLTQAQLGYAENDVRYLLPLYERLGSRLKSLHRYEWAIEDFQALLDPGLYQTDPEQAYRRVGRGANLAPRAQHILKRLCAWRERVARARNLPRNWIMDDDTLASIATARPRSREDLERMEGVRRDVVRREGGEILACIHDGPEDPVPLLWSRRVPLTEEQKALRAALVDVLKARATGLGLAQSVLLTRSDLERLVRGAPPAEIIRGWRWEVIGRALSEVLSGAEAAPGAAGRRA